ncbi:hypothetical protein ACIOKD_17165 [Streptomyces sp. NPDC087844]|uniref:hypothetical protein n=1 Tax=Streptomyces sp. NPDC087844 TaxID=3365805 RepID=UPI00382CCFD6
MIFVEKKFFAVMSITVALLGSAACGDNNNEGAEEKPLAKAEISQAVLRQGDVPGYTIRDNSGVKSDPTARAAEKSCQPVVAVMAPTASRDVQRLAVRSITKTPTGSEVPKASYLLVLSSANSEAAAKQAVHDLRSAISACSSGFKVTFSGEDYAIRHMTVNDSGLGEEGVDFSLEYQMGRKIRYAVVQNGASVTSVSASDQSERNFVAIPQKILSAQQQKLDKAAG